jgi:hypothetical protein
MGVDDLQSWRRFRIAIGAYDEVPVPKSGSYWVVQNLTATGHTTHSPHLLPPSDRRVEERERKYVL